MASIVPYETRQGRRYRVRYHRTAKDGFVSESDARKFARSIEEKDHRLGCEQMLARHFPPPPAPEPRKKVDKEYKYAHGQVYALRGKAVDHPCADCGKPAAQWSYDHADYFEETTASGLPYSNDPTHYQPRCASCHRLFDLRMHKIPRATATAAERKEHRQRQEEEEETDAYATVVWPR